MEKTNEYFRSALKPVFIITRREIRDQLRDWRIVVPVVVLTSFFPWILNFTANQFASFLQSYNANVIADRIIPLLLMLVGFFPITVSLAIALETFVGEKERRSIEPLLSSPLEDWQLYFGKLLASLVLPMTAAILGILVYLAGIFQSLHYTPPLILITLVIFLTLMQALVMVSGAVVVSTQTTSVRASNLLASFIVVPMALIVQAEGLAMFWVRYDVLFWAGVGMVLIAIMLVRMGLAYFNREELLGRELDAINLRWAWHTFWKGFVGEAKNRKEWFTVELPRTFHRMILPAGLVLALLADSVVIGAAMIHYTPLRAEVFSKGGLSQQVSQNLQNIPFFSVGGIPLIWFHNIRALTLATLLGIFSFGVLGVIVIMLPLFIVGYLASAASIAGISPLLFMAGFILPHGTLEIPAIVLAGAAILRLGATLFTPAHGQTIGEAFLTALADWFKVMIAMVIPLLLGAATIEVLITPWIAIHLLQ